MFFFLFSKTVDITCNELGRTIIRKPFEYNHMNICVLFGLCLDLRLVRIGLAFCSLTNIKGFGKAGYIREGIVGLLHCKFEAESLASPVRHRSENGARSSQVLVASQRHADATHYRIKH